MASNGESLGNQVATVQAHGSELSTCCARGLDSGLHALGDVVGIDQESCRGTKRSDLCVKGLAFAVVKQRERMCCSTNRGDSITLSGLEIRGSRETSDDGGACR